jgi:uncharacterized membrane protein
LNLKALKITDLKLLPTQSLPIMQTWVIIYIVLFALGCILFLLFAIHHDWQEMEQHVQEDIKLTVRPSA